MTSSTEEPQTYTRVAKALHWAIAACVLIQYFTKLASPRSFAGVSERSLNAWHLAVGPTILLLMLVRLAWRLTHKPPPPPADLAPALRLISQVTHWAFYGLLIVVPILGWMAASGYGVPATLFGLIPLPALLPEAEGVGEHWGDVHGLLAWVTLALIALHLGGAAYHGLAKDDGVFARMLL